MRLEFVGFVLQIFNNCVTCFVIGFVDGFFVISIGFLDIN